MTLEQFQRVEDRLKEIKNEHGGYRLAFYVKGNHEVYFPKTYAILKTADPFVTLHCERISTRMRIYDYDVCIGLNELQYVEIAYNEALKDDTKGTSQSDDIF